MARWDIAVVAAALLGGIYLIKQSGQDLYNAVSQLSPATQVKEVYNTTVEKLSEVKTDIQNRETAFRDVVQSFGLEKIGYPTDVKDVGMGANPILDWMNKGWNFGTKLGEELFGKNKITPGAGISYVPDASGNPTNILIREPGVTDLTGTHKMLSEVYKPPSGSIYSIQPVENKITEPKVRGYSGDFSDPYFYEKPVSQWKYINTMGTYTDVNVNAMPNPKFAK